MLRPSGTRWTTGYHALLEATQFATATSGDTTASKVATADLSQSLTIMALEYGYHDFLNSHEVPALKLSNTVKACILSWTWLLN